MRRLIERDWFWGVVAVVLVGLVLVITFVITAEASHRCEDNATAMSRVAEKGQTLLFRGTVDPGTDPYRVLLFVADNGSWTLATVPADMETNMICSVLYGPEHEIVRFLDE